MAQGDPVAQLNQAIELFKAGEREEAFSLLRALTQQRPDMEMAWMWLAAVTEDTDQKISALQRVLKINPANEKARGALTRLTGTVPPPDRPKAEPMAAPAGRNTGIVVLLGLLLATAVVVVVAALLSNPRIQGLLRPTASFTASPTQSLTPTLRLSLTPTNTPGGPTATQYELPTLPPTWTTIPTNTVIPSFTPQPSDTPNPSATVIAQNSVTPFISPTPTSLPTLVPIPTLPSGTPEPLNATITTTPTNTATATATLVIPPTVSPGIPST